jgi:hypothetical protein
MEVKDEATQVAGTVGKRTRKPMSEAAKKKAAETKAANREKKASQNEAIAPQSVEPDRVTDLNGSEMNQSDSSISARPKKMKRVSLEQTEALVADVRSGFKRRWCHDTPATIERYIKLGWDFVLDPSGRMNTGAHKVDASGNLDTRVSRSHANGISYLMEQDEKAYEEDQMFKAREISRKEEAMKRKLKKDNDGFSFTEKVEKGHYSKERLE